MRGGARSGSGRKIVADKMVQLPIYVRASEVEALGRELIRQICREAVESKVKKKGAK